MRATRALCERTPQPANPVWRTILRAVCIQLGISRLLTNHRRNMRDMVRALSSAAASASRLTRRNVYA
jgi:hypothetical protein